MTLHGFQYPEVGWLLETHGLDAKSRVKGHKPDDEIERIDYKVINQWGFDIINAW